MIGIGAQTVDGAVEVLDLPTPRQPETGELLLETITAGIGPWDALLHITDGWDVELKPPAALGVEGVGRIIAIGAGVEGFNVGDVVVVHDTPLPGGSGFWAEQVLVHASSAALLPPGLSPEIAAALPVAALTASQSLKELQVGAGTRLLVVGSGPTAVMAIRLGVLASAEVVAAASPRHSDRLRKLGAVDLIDSHAENWAQSTSRRFDAVLIAADGVSEEAMKLIDDGGRLTSLTSDAPEPTRGITANNLYIVPDGADLERLAKLAAAGELSLDVATVTADQGPATEAIVATGGSRGVKYVINFGTPTESKRTAV
ncbi:alcohol dehydrogenase catalytic domain-containing protein [Diaminobutyricibacter tongyongensis]|uniref:Alcohol dehydrogenase catalytic domain-containing protein n=1 Tax=Leifsonia tongyongensis TaxID=1268043 RepID=A0A6L9Y302_9MICO|nr:alcohol dehydrogenase catalytic domain-containing protein [Diaminobutyricibacter tongyongensis]NEN07797.1 alcohol dehydrogenase catalytic domain-containing protein [Diaminobutyricibacter tongyongensis]